MNATAIANLTATFLEKQAWFGSMASGRRGLGGGASLWSILGSFTSPSDLLKIFLLGGFLETFRRFFWRAIGYLVSYCYLTATVETNEPSYQWILLWLSQRQSWNNSRAVLITQPAHGDITRGSPAQRHNAEMSKHDRPVEFQPMFGTKCSLWYKGSWIQIHRNRGLENPQLGQMQQDSMMFSILFGGHEKLRSLLLEAKALYKSRVANRIRIWTSQSSRGWNTSIVRPKRGMESVVLDEGIKSMLLDDANEFLRSEQWYADRGIPWRRGYLLHGCPGSGKTSLIHALAGELDLDIYVISLSQRDMDDSVLNRLITTLPPKSIALMEDIDVAFTRGPDRPVERKTTRKGINTFADGYGNTFIDPVPMNTNSNSNSGSSITLAGLLGAIDGVAAQEGRILFATTNRYHTLDTALKRPGRLDIHIEFREASKKQAEELFKRFYPAQKEKVPGEGSRPDDVEKPLIDLTSAGISASNGILSEKSSIASPTTSDEPEPEPTITVAHPKEAPRLTESELSEMAARFASILPEREFTMAAIQGHLMRYKTQPHRAIEETGAFIQREREQKEADRRLRELTDHEGDKLDVPKEKDGGEQIESNVEKKGEDGK